MSDNPLRNLPSVTQVLDAPAVVALRAEYGHDRTVEAVRATLANLRASVRAAGIADGECDLTAVAERVAAHLRESARPKLRPVINATGIVLHTNLGRAPIAEAAARAASDAAKGYLNLELDLASGERSSRSLAIREWVCRLTGAESATAVNNCAAATVIVLRALAAGREVIVSRGQLVEIGGSFRIPEIMGVSSATLREVGTTNITRAADYERAIGPNTGLLMRIHQSNFRIHGFTETPTLEELVALGRKHNLPVVDDIGSGALVDFSRFGLDGEPVARASVAAGADLILFSGDKLLGGPQAGIIAGRAELVKKIERDPLMRAFRLDKMTLAALEATLRLYLHEERAMADVPILRMLGLSKEDLRRRATALADRLHAIPGLRAGVRNDVAFVGGGSMPDRELPTAVIEIVARNISDAELAARLRTGTPAVLGRVQDGKVLLDVRTVFDDQIDPLVEAVQAAVAVSS
ncbi:MAG TPA: L-seryl-tRNA(Sec) selenium transferase [Gemmataceae bacterium]|jgi:L-seryl-tRNA(Ser) seleniumtransferase|nr:L-seryl-tRNA(Sec) selenium transferase [Gemmataceae bacterium]